MNFKTYHPWSNPLPTSVKSDISLIMVFCILDDFNYGVIILAVNYTVYKSMNS